LYSFAGVLLLAGGGDFSDSNTLGKRGIDRESKVHDAVRVGCRHRFCFFIFLTLLNFMDYKQGVFADAVMAVMSRRAVRLLFHYPTLNIVSGDLNHCGCLVERQQFRLAKTDRAVGNN
jgi:hypothetical protein